MVARWLLSLLWLARSRLATGNTLVMTRAFGHCHIISNSAAPPGLVHINRQHPLCPCHNKYVYDCCSTGIIMLEV